MSSIPLDRLILETAGDGKLAKQLVAEAIATGANWAEVCGRMRALRKNRFLLPLGESPCLAELRAQTSYVTFMVNVLQRCNLTCPYCYANKGFFDYEEKPIPRMEAATADQIVEKLHKNFPGFETYGYHSFVRWRTKEG